MEIKEQVLSRKRDFNTTLCLTGVIPFLVCVYLISVKVSSLNIFVGEVGYIMFTTLIVFLLGIVVGRKMLSSMVTELIERNRLIAITETTLTLSHEINNPLLTMRGNLELLEMDLPENMASLDTARNRIFTIKNNCERIREATEKLTKLTKPATTTIHEDSKMIDLGVSK